MPQIIVDTDVFSYIFKKDSRALPFRSYVDGIEICLAFATVAELFFGAYNANWGSKTFAEMEKELTKYMILRSNYNICRLYGKGRFKCKKQQIDDPDYWIAACARYYNVPLLTNNWRHFKDIEGLQLVSPGHS